MNSETKAFVDFGGEEPGCWLLCIPADEAREFLEGIIAVCIYDAEGTLADEIIMPKARALLALLPEVEDECEV